MPYALNLERSQREEIRWRILRALDVSRPVRLGENVLFRTLTDIDLPIGPRQLRRELLYLIDKGLVDVRSREAAVWSLALTPDGIDVVEYTIEAPDGVGRPPRYWNEQ